MEDATVLAQKILSCVVRLGERYGAAYTTDVLTGAATLRIEENGHNTLSTYGLLSGEKRAAVREWIDQLIDQGALRREGEFNLLKVTPKGWRILRGETVPRLLTPRGPRISRSKAAEQSWEGVDQSLFDALRQVRTTLARRRGVPAYVIFTDAALRAMAREKPVTPEAFLAV